MSTVKELHRDAMHQADLAHDARRRGNAEEARAHFEKAFLLERSAAEQLANQTDSDTEPSRSILLRSAATLALHCDQSGEAERLVCGALAGSPPAEIAEELRDLYEQINFHRHLKIRGIILSPEEIQMSFVGDGIGFGIAPTEQVLERLDKAQAMLYRIAERKLQKPYRDHGQPTRDIKDSVSLYISVPRAASFAVSLVVGGKQQVLPGMSTAESVIDEVIECLDLFVNGDEETLKEKIPDEAYYSNFVGLAKAMSPDGREVTTVGFTALKAGVERTVALKPRRPPVITVQAIEAPSTTKALTEQRKVVGLLKFADSLEHREPQIRLIDDNGVKHTIVVPVGMMDDIVRPLWGSRVIVTGTPHKNQILLSDIVRSDG